MKLITILALVLSSIATPQPVQRAVSLVYVQPQGETFTDEERTRAYTTTDSALVWWQQLAPNPVNTTITSEQMITITDTFDIEWLTPYLIPDNPNITILIVDNSTSMRMLWGETAGQAQDYYGLIVVVNTVPGDLAAPIAHELGHVVYHLHDIRDNCTLDIMCYSSVATAYNLRTLGCVSLEKLGGRCYRVYLPDIAE